MRLWIVVAVILVGVAAHAHGTMSARQESAAVVETAVAAKDRTTESYAAHVLSVPATVTAAAEDARRTAVDDFLNEGWTVGNCQVTADRQIARTIRKNEPVGAPAPMRRCRVLPNGGLYTADWRDTPTPSPVPTRSP